MITVNNFKKTPKRSDAVGKITLCAASRMKRKSDPLSVKAKVIILLIFCFIAGAACIYLITDSLINKKSTLLIIKPKDIPPSSMLSKYERTKAVLISEAEYQRIHRYGLYIDSLTQAVSGEAIQDSLQQKYRGLIDSIRFIENIYQSQNKN